ncbi:MAG TPA: carbamoyltransferase C-terminal domain-containing protein [Vicinamibacterales bacterium]|nr:carbamoyltransferase C-terminal domain-containing protein [Vicinamibacterales bacterium]
MKVLGISGRDRDAAAALSIDGRIVAAVTEESFARVAGIGYAQTGGVPVNAVDACLTAAGVATDAVDEVVVVGDVVGDAGKLARSSRVMDAVEADARHAAMTTPASRAVIVCGANPPVMALFRREGDGVAERRDVAGAPAIFAGASALASTLGLSTTDSLAELDRLGAGTDPEFAEAFSAAIVVAGNAAGVSADPAAIAAAAKTIGGDHAALLGDPRSLNARVQQKRRALAASFTASLAGVVAKIAECAGTGNGSSPVAAGGGAFGNAGFNSALQGIVGDRLSLAAVPEPSGRALGAVAGAGHAAALAIGPAFSEEAIKRTLDNCRLDYVYEPDWARLLARVSKMLAQGKIVGWFQGPMAFGPRPLGTRSILADPSNRYARQNVNEYLRDLPLDTPLPLVVAPTMAASCLASDAPAFGSRDVEVRADWRPLVAAALDGRHAARIHGPSARFESRLRDLLEHHYASTGTPGLIEIGLSGAAEPTACTPRDAVRTMYSSAIDALVLGRFLLMKDYWLLRSQE